jgi:hypothetical protein
MISLVTSEATDTINDGQRLSQAELDSINTDTISLRCSASNYKLSLTSGIVYPYTCLNIKSDGKNYLAYYQDSITQFDISYLVKCIFQFEHCKENMREKILRDIKLRKAQIRNQIKDMQTKSIEGYDWSINLGDLN